MTKTEDEQYGPEETARRRDAIVRRMITTPPKAHKPLGKGKPKKATPRRKKQNGR
jgi:hypothetical protein